MTTCTQHGNITNKILSVIGRYSHTESHTGLRIAECVKVYSEQYKLPYMVVSRLIETESRFKQFAYNSGSEARGLGQIVDYHWRYSMWHIDDGKLGKYLNENNYTNIERLKRYYYRIGYATEMTCFALDACRKIAKGDLAEGLYIYGGGRSRGACQNHMEDYTNYIVSGN